MKQKIIQYTTATAKVLGLVATLPSLPFWGLLPTKYAAVGLSVVALASAAKEFLTAIGQYEEGPTTPTK